LIHGSGNCSGSVTIAVAVMLRLFSYNVAVAFLLRYGCVLQNFSVTLALPLAVALRNAYTRVKIKVEIQYEVKILIFKEIKSHFCRGLKIQP